eukprot:6598522-Prymnesium_polylepis.2
MRTVAAATHVAFELRPEARDQPLLCDHAERTSAQLDGLSEARLAAGRDADGPNELGQQLRVEVARGQKVIFELGRAGQHPALEYVRVAMTLGGKVCSRELGHLLHVRAALLEADALETRCRLPAAPVVVWQGLGELLEHGLDGSRE